MSLYAKAGETVTCENGHPIADVKQDIEPGAVFLPHRYFERWRQPEPAIGLPVACAQCKAPFYWGNPLGSYRLHFQDGWRV